MAISEFTINNYLQEKKEYFCLRNKRIKANSISECNTYFKMTDNYIRVLISGIKRQTDKARLPDFKIPIRVDFSPRSILGKRCCDCPSDPVPFYLKNNARDLAENFLNKWCEAAKSYLIDKNKPKEVGAQKRAPIVIKNPMK